MTDSSGVSSTPQLLELIMTSVFTGSPAFARDDTCGIRFKNLRCVLRYFRPASTWSMGRRLSQARRDNGRCQPGLSNENSSNAVRRSGLDSWSAKLRPPSLLPRFVPIARAPPPVWRAPEDDWDSNTGLRA